MFVLTSQLVDKTSMETSVPQAQLKAWKQYAQDPIGVRNMLSHIFGSESKQVALKVSNGGKVPEPIEPGEAQEFLVALSEESRLLRWWACALLPDLHEYVLKNTKKVQLAREHSSALRMGDC